MEQEGKAEEKSQEFLDLSDYVRDIRDMYKKDLAQETFNALVLGQVGAGKTTLAGTARKPLYVHSFDPGGTKVFKNFNADNPKKSPRDLFETGEAIADTRFEGDDSEQPRAYREWEREFKNMRRKNMFEHVGTYVMDSFTTWVLSLKYQILKKQKRTDGIMQIQDWQVLGNTVKDVINVMTALPCDVILTGHLTTEKDDVSGRIETRLQAIPSLQTELPLMFDEIYCLEANETPHGIERALITANTGKYQARTRIGSGGIFDTREDPDIKNLLRKAGYPTEDKPLIPTEQ